MSCCIALPFRPKAIDALRAVPISESFEAWVRQLGAPLGAVSTGSCPESFRSLGVGERSGTEPRTRSLQRQALGVESSLALPFGVDACREDENSLGSTPLSHQIPVSQIGRSRKAGCTARLSCAEARLA